jgi:hypothetical protein
MRLAIKTPYRSTPLWLQRGDWQNVARAHEKASQAPGEAPLTRRLLSLRLFPRSSVSPGRIGSCGRGRGTVDGAGADAQAEAVLAGALG